MIDVIDVMATDDALYFTKKIQRSLEKKDVRYENVIRDLKRLLLLVECKSEYSRCKGAIIEYSSKDESENDPEKLRRCMKAQLVSYKTDDGSYHILKSRFSRNGKAIPKEQYDELRNEVEEHVTKIISDTERSEDD